MKNRLVCICNVVSVKEIITTFNKGASCTSDIQKITRAGTTCGKCLVEIDGLVEEFLSRLPENPQQRINF
jgi:bacterioferritin-associated ferredoxin